MNIANIKYNDIANGPGVRTSLFVSGCRNHCKGCFNQETWDFNFGYEFTKEVEDKIIKSLKQPWVSGLTILGGEPFEPENQIALLPFLKRVRFEVPKATIWAYSGRVFEDLTNPNSAWHCSYTDELLSNLNVLVDGPFIEEKKNISLKFRGSENQRIIDIPATIITGKIVEDEN